MASLPWTMRRAGVVWMRCYATAPQPQSAPTPPPLPTPTPTTSPTQSEAKEPMAGAPKPSPITPMQRRVASALGQMDARLKQEQERLKRERQAYEAAHPLPSDGQLTWKQRMSKRMSEYLDLEENTKVRQELLKKAFIDGYWDDAKQVARVQGSKLWEASERLRAAKDAKLMPDLKGRTLAGTKTTLYELIQQKAAVVAFVTSAFSENHVLTYLNPLRKQLEENKVSFPIIVVQIEENRFKGWVLALLRPWNRLWTPKDQRTMRFLPERGHDFYEYRQHLGMSNKHFGWVHLLDTQSRVRWQAHGPASAKEIQTLCKHVLNSGKSTGTPPSTSASASE